MTMKKFLIGTTVLGLLLILPFRSMIVETVTARTERIEVVKEGDVIFQTSQSKQSPLIQIGTRSKITHCGIIVMKNGKPYVLETLQPLVFSLLNKFIARGKIRW